ncbi:MAG: class I SAM-dependent methyltransferase [Bacteroidia bacterium]|nr:class I SAM-dependent methyltransferase [Bacteroidia bacterium]
MRAKNYYLSVELFGGALPEQEWGKKVEISLGGLVRRAATPPWKGKLLYLIARETGAEKVLELGTHVGIGTLYLHSALPRAAIHTVEASPALAAQSKRHFRLFGFKPFCYVGTFREVLPRLEGVWDLIYLDGDHRGEAFFEYASWSYDHLVVGGMLVCDDIFWSRDMYEGWKRVSTLNWAKQRVIGPFGILQR